MSDTAPWMYSALSQLRELEQTGRVIPGVGDLRLGIETANIARLLLSLIDITDLPVPVVAPVSRGGLSIVWSMGEKEVKFSCTPDASPFYFACLDDDVVDEGTVDLGVASTARAPLAWMLQSRR